MPSGDGGDGGDFERPLADVGRGQRLEAAARVGPRRRGDEDLGVAQCRGHAQLVAAGARGDDEEAAHGLGYSADEVVLAISSVQIDIGLLAVFVVLFPLLVNGLIAFIAAQIVAERRANQNAHYDRAPNE
jgi:hypothetical protein